MVITDGPGGETLELVGRPCGWQIEWRNDDFGLNRYGYDYERPSRLRVSLELDEPSTRTLKPRSFDLWERTCEWLRACPLIRQPETTAYPVI